LAAGLVAAGHRITVYNSSNHPYQQKNWNAVQLVHCYDPSSYLGTGGQFVYDFNCIRHARNCDYDIVLFLGYTSSSVWKNWFPKKAIIISNMDGMEWKRAKYNWFTRRFLKLAEKWAVNASDYLIADSMAVKKAYLLLTYHQPVEYISYGAVILSISKNKQLVSLWFDSATVFYGDGTLRA
jgi:hypothetical protein